MMVMFIKYLQYAKYASKPFICTDLFVLHNNSIYQML